MNSVSLNVSYIDESLRINFYYPTVDLGLSDSVRILNPSKSLVDIFQLNQMKEIFSYETIKLLKRVEKIRDAMSDEPASQYEIFKLLSKNPD